jgi:hypothetical protein
MVRITQQALLFLKRNESRLDFFRAGLVSKVAKAYLQRQNVNKECIVIQIVPSLLHSKKLVALE